MHCRHDPGGCAACRARVRFSRLKLIGQSPAHYQAAVDKETPAKERGRALHALVLGGPEVLCYPGKVRNGKEWEMYQAAHPGALILNRTDHGLVSAMAESVLRHPDAVKYLSGEHEVEVDWSFLGRPCQSHIDCIGPGGEWISELKSSVTSEPERFSWQSHRMGYPAQLAFYMAALQVARGTAPKEAYVVAVEQAPPHVVTVMRATDRLLDMGAKTVRLWMERLLSCEAANDWPGYVQSVVDLDAPAEDVELTFGEGEEAA